MPARCDIRKILIIGSGPIVIGQACEFDYSGNQAVRALKEEGYEIVLLNPNPATVMSTPGYADSIYLDPLDAEYLLDIIKKETPDAILPTMGGQSALNLVIEFTEMHDMKKLGVELIGAGIQSINLAEDRGQFKKTMSAIGLESPFSKLVHSEAAAHEVATTIGFPLIIRPSFTLGGQGGSIAYSADEFQEKIRRALSISPTHSALVEESLLGYQEFEFEVMRDTSDNALIVCSIENIDPMGVHTGDSITIAPIQTLSDIEYQRLRTASIDVIRAVGVECGGANVQFAYHPEKERLLVIEMNPRVSRSSALASKATGFPIARCAAKLAVGYTLDEVINEITGKTTVFFEPALDYCAVKVPRFELKKFPISELGTQMRSIGEALALGRSFPEALNKALRASEMNVEGLQSLEGMTSLEIDAIIETLHPRRIFGIYTRLLEQEGQAVCDDIVKKTGFHPWVVYHLASVAHTERSLRQYIGLDLTQALHDQQFVSYLAHAKQMGFSDIRIQDITGIAVDDIYKIREAHGILKKFHCVDTCAGEFEANTPFFYGTYGEEDEHDAITPPAIAIIGSGPNRIGQGLEFDTCCTLAAHAFRKRGIQVVMINSNPETVSTDYNVSDRLYIEALTAEDVLDVLRKEQITTAVVQLGGQTPINMAKTLQKHGIEFAGTSLDVIDRAENRKQFSMLLEDCALQQAPSTTVDDVQYLATAAEHIGYPVLIRPSYVLGGQSMVVVYSKDELEKFIALHHEALKGTTILVDTFLERAVEYDVDLVSDGMFTYIGGILRHIEQAGIHSGDSACVFEAHMPEGVIPNKIYRAVIALIEKLSIKGLANIQFASVDDELYVLEVNPRASRTVPFISKSSGVDLVDMAVAVWQGEPLSEMSIFKDNVHPAYDTLAVGRSIEGWAVKEAVFSFDRFDGIDPALGPEMRSTGEVIGLGRSFGEAFAKASAMVSSRLPRTGTVFISIADAQKPLVLAIARTLIELDFTLTGTHGTAQYLTQHDIPCRAIMRIADGSPNVLDEIHSGRVDLMINLPESVDERSFHDDKEIRIAAVRYRIPYVTTFQALEATIEGIIFLKKNEISAQKLTSI